VRLSDFDYALPDALIARHPPAERGSSRLLDLRGPAPVDRGFGELPALLAAGELLVLNDTRVLKARLSGRKESGGRIEVLIERPLPDGEWLAMLRSSHAPQPGSRLILGDGATVEVMGRDGDLFRLRLDAGSGDMLDLMSRCGELPLPPYLSRAPEAADEARYQTVYSRAAGAVAAPTAGLHFSQALLDTLQAGGVEIAYLTLHVGAGTFQPVRCEELRDHRMHPERYWIPETTRAAVARARARGARITAVGTTSLRALEAAAADAEAPARLAAGGDTRLFITPGYRFAVVDRLLTNFHLPRSTLLMLVQAFGGVDRMRAAYQHAIEQRYRFFSYGDAMLIDPDPSASSRPAAFSATPPPSRDPSALGDPH
jgi:S-adenosylmethionine:tRNA ribosyltransferase-isomerase